MTKPEYLLSQFYKQSLALLTDLYQLTMSYGYWKAGLDNKGSCLPSLLPQNIPFKEASRLQRD